jgi:hypothetical protein
LESTAVEQVVLECTAGQLAGVFMRFTIRDLVLVTTIVGLSLGWLIDRSQLYEVASTPEGIWHHRAEMMASVLRDDGWEVTWSRNYMHFKRGKEQIDSGVIGAGALPEDSN